MNPASIAQLPEPIRSLVRTLERLGCQVEAVTSDQCCTTGPPEKEPAESPDISAFKASAQFGSLKAAAHLASLKAAAHLAGLKTAAHLAAGRLVPDAASPGPQLTDRAAPPRPTQLGMPTLHWRLSTITRDLLGYFPTEPENTLFFISARSNGGYQLHGFTIPDRETYHGEDIGALQHHAQETVACWFARHLPTDPSAN